MAILFCCGVAALGLVVVLGLHFPLVSTAPSSASSSAPPSEPPSQQTTAKLGLTAEERPPAGAGLVFTQANIRYCTFQQVRLEAVGPIINNADLAVFSALVDDWNARCARYRYAPSDKSAIDAEASDRRTLLEAEGRAHMSGWRRKIKIATTVQPVPTPTAAGLEPGLDLGPGPEVGDPSAAAAEYPKPAASLPLLITLGRGATDDSEREGGLRLTLPSLTLLRVDVAMRVQQRLNELGYTISPADGTWGSMSRHALRRFKEANGLLGNDAFDAETATRLFSMSAIGAPRGGASQLDDASHAVETAYPPPSAASLNPLNRIDGRRIQHRLAALGYYSRPGNGLWGAASRRALRKFKVMNGLTDDDDWNAMTEAVLFDDQAARAPETFVGNPRRNASGSAAGPMASAPPKRAPPSTATARSGEPPLLAASAREVPRPPGLIPAPPTPRPSLNGLRQSP